MFKKVASWFGKGAKGSSEGAGIFGSMTPEELCKIDPETMDAEDIRLQLAKLYKRHNHAAGSLNSDLREEADLMLKAIVYCREKYVEP